MATPAHLANSTAELLTAAAAGAHPVYLLFRGHRAPKDGSTGKSCLSQWFPAPFEVDGVRYATAEHYMMAGKARLFGDAEIAGRIVANEDPSTVKALGRRIKGFDEATWTQHRCTIVEAGNLAKFSQNAALRKFLLDTSEDVLVEASPVDAIWGIGLAADDARALDPAQWQGLNLLGFALMQVRRRLRDVG
jgi:ribA/ribD-fused uncharacterized protein